MRLPRICTPISGKVFREAAALAVAGLFGASCASHHDTTTTTSAPTTTTTSPATTSTTSGASGPAHCQPSDLAGSVVGSQGAAGTNEVTFALRNTGSSACSLEGYPGILLYDKSGAALPTTVVRGGNYRFTSFPASPVVLSGGTSAYFNLAFSDVPTNGAPCPTASSLSVTAPDDVDHLTVTYEMQACSGKVTVSPVFAQDSPETQTTAPKAP